MPSLYTNNTGIEKPGTGDQSGTWGVTTNTNFDIIDRALHGQISIPIYGSQDLVTNDGSVSDGAYAVLVLTGTPGVTFELRVTPTDQEKNFTIVNDTDAACRVIYKGVTYSTSNGVEIASGAAQAVTGDGGGATGVFRSLTPNTDLVNDVSPQLGGNLDVNGYNIVSVSNGNINLTPNGTGEVRLNSDALVTGQLRADDITLTGTSISAATLNSNLSIDGNGTGKVLISNLSYPDTDGTANQVMVTDGSGTLSFANASSSLGGTLTLGDWTITVVSNELVFSYQSTAVAKIGTTGQITSANDLTAFGTI